MSASAAVKSELDSVPEWGTAMRALTSQQQAFVCAYFDHPFKQGRNLHAASVARYGKADGTSTTTVMKAIGWRVAHDELVQTAILEESRRRRVALTPTALNALENVLKDPKHKDHTRAIAIVLDRSDPLQVNHSHVVEDRREVSNLTIEQVRDKIDELARLAGVVLPPRIPPKVIDADYSVVVEATP